MEEALAEDPTNEEVLAMKNDVLELIAITQKLIDTKKAASQASLNQQAKVDLDSLYLDPLATVAHTSVSAASVAAPARVAASGTSTTSSKSVIERAQASGIYVGLKCEAIWSGDENWYSAEVSEINAEGVTVRFIEYGDVETIAPERIRLEGGRGKKRKEAEPGSVAFEVPKWLQILPTDTEDARKAKKKRIKALKLQNKIQVREEETKQKKASWQEFAQSASKKRKFGSLTGMRKESIFKSPDSLDGKVGVTGSGKGMTQQSKVEFKPKKTGSAAPIPPVAGLPPQMSYPPQFHYASINQGPYGSGH